MWFLLFLKTRSTQNPEKQRFSTKNRPRESSTRFFLFERPHPRSCSPTRLPHPRSPPSRLGFFDFFLDVFGFFVFFLFFFEFFLTF